MGKSLEQLLPAQLQQARHSQPDLKQRASSLVLMDVHHATMDVHAAGLGRKGGKEEKETEMKT